MRTLINLYLDDLRPCPENFVLAKNIEEAKEIMKENKVAIFSLDHDLGQDKEGNILPTGYDFVKYLCETGLDETCKAIYLHTDNPVGKENMRQLLRNAKKHGVIPSGIEVYPHKYYVDYEVYE